MYGKVGTVSIEVSSRCFPCLLDVPYVCYSSVLMGVPWGGILKISFLDEYFRTYIIDWVGLIAMRLAIFSDTF